MKKEARKGYLLGAGGALALGLSAAATGIPALILMGVGAVALFKGCQTIHDKILIA